MSGADGSSSEAGPSSPPSQTGADRLRKDSVVNLLTVSDLKDLPTGICIKPEKYVSANGLLGQKIQTLADKHDPDGQLGSGLMVHLDINDTKIIAGSLITMYCQCLQGRINENSPPRELSNFRKLERIMTALLDEYPDLSFMRGAHTAISEDGATAILDDYGEGINGLIGDMKVLNWVYRSYGGGERSDPCLMVIPLKRIIEAARKKIIQVGSEHLYDLQIRKNLPGTSREYLQWCSDAVKVFTFGAEKETELQMAENILASKAVPISS